MKYLHTITEINELPEWVILAVNELDQNLKKKDFPCLLGIMAHRKNLTQIGFIERSETNQGQKLAKIMTQYVTLVRSTSDNKTAGLLPLIVFIERSENENLDDTHHRCWELLTEATMYDQSEWIENAPKAPNHPEFIYVFAGEKWFINVSSYCHEERKSRHLGSHIVLAMQTLTGSNRFYENKEEKLSWQKRIRERTEKYDGMAVYKGLGSLDEIGEPTPLIESYFLPDTNHEVKPKFWENVMKPFNYFLFDFDGTLADTARCGVVATQLAFEAVQLPIPTEQQIIQAMGIPIEKSFKDFGAAHFTDEEFSNLLTIFRKFYAEKADDLIQIFDGSLELLKNIKKQNGFTAIVSSKKSGVLQKNAEFLGIAEYIDCFIGSDMVHNYKPDPEGIYVALKQLDYQGKRDDVIYIGDATTDIQMGSLANVKTCAVTWGAHSKSDLLDTHPTYLADNFSELASILVRNTCPYSAK